MTTAHLNVIELSAYVDGELVGIDAWEIERHVATCRRCAAGLERAARLEMAMFEVAARQHGPRARRSWHHRLMPVLAAAATMVCWASFGVDGVTPSAPPEHAVVELGAVCSMPASDDTGGVCRAARLAAPLCSVEPAAVPPAPLCSGDGELLYTPLEPSSG